LQTTPPKPRKDTQQLLTPPITPLELLRRRRDATEEDAQSDLIIVKRRKLKSGSPSTAFTPPSENPSPVHMTHDANNAKVNMVDTTTTTSVVEVEEAETESFTLTCVPTCIYNDADAHDEEITLICCDSCDSWQHNKCLGLPEEADDLPELFYCGLCRPIWFEGLVRAIKENSTLRRDSDSSDIFAFAEAVDGSSSIVDTFEVAITTSPTRISKRKDLSIKPVSEPLRQSTVKEQKMPVKTYSQRYNEMRALFAGSSRRGREEAAIMTRRDSRSGRM